MSPWVAITLLAACSSPEGQAGAAALKFSSLPAADLDSRHALACAEDREARSVEDLKALQLGGGLLANAIDELARQANATHSVKATTLNEAKDAADVVIGTSIPREGAAPLESTETVHVRREADTWCVSTGWAEEKRQKDAADALGAVLDKAGTLTTDWKFDEAKAALTEADTDLAALPPSYAAHDLLAQRVEATQKLYDSLRSGWVGGRWRVSETTDPMTDDRNTLATLTSTGTLSNSIGQEKNVSLIVRCRRNELEAYVATDTMIDSNWMYDSVSGQQRFGTDPPQRFSGTISSDHESVFLRDPAKWIEQFRAREADGWTIELPIYGKTPQSVRFDLTASSKALAAIPSTCR